MKERKEGREEKEKNRWFLHKDIHYGKTLIVYELSQEELDEFSMDFSLKKKVGGMRFFFSFLYF